MQYISKPMLLSKDQFANIGEFLLRLSILSHTRVSVAEDVINVAKYCNKSKRSNRKDGYAISEEIDKFQLGLADLSKIIVTAPLFDAVDELQVAATYGSKSKVSKRRNRYAISEEVGKFQLGLTELSKSIVTAPVSDTGDLLDRVQDVELVKVELDLVQVQPYINAIYCSNTPLLDFLIESEETEQLSSGPNERSY